MTQKKSDTTLYIHIDKSKCIACWKCIGICHKDIIKKVSILWHKHIKLNNNQDCSGCLKCVKTCPEKVFVKIENIKNNFK